MEAWSLNDISTSDRGVGRPGQVYESPAGSAELQEGLPATVYLGTLDPWSPSLDFVERLQMQGIALDFTDFQGEHSILEEVEL